MGDVIEMAEMRKKESGHQLRLSFEGRPGACPCADFALGFEAGRLDLRLHDLPSGEPWGGTYHAANRLMLERIAEANGCSIALSPADDAGHWLFADFVKG